MAKKTILYDSSSEERIDKHLSLKFPDIPRRFFQNKIKEGAIVTNGKKVSPSYQLKEGDKIEFEEKILEEAIPKIPNISPEENIPFKIIFQNEEFAVIEKPAGLTVHPSESQVKNTLVNGLLSKFPQIANVGESPLRPGIVHRLDKDTSGLMIVALTQTSFQYFKKLFQNRNIEKKYQALVWGKLDEKEGKIETYIGRSKRNPVRQATNKNPELLSNPKQALTIYKVIKEFDELTLIEATPKTGRKHQIRIHFHSIGHPLVGDKKYQTKLLKEKNKPYNRHLLHASFLKFTYRNGKIYEFSSELPTEFKF